LSADLIATKITETEAALANERGVIAAAIAVKQIGDGYWKRRHELECRLSVLRTLQEALTGEKA
jgi:hypothetical protein